MPTRAALGEIEALRAYARMWNRCDVAPFSLLPMAPKVTMTFPTGKGWDTARGRHHVAALLLILVERALSDGMRDPGRTIRAELADIEWDGGTRPAVVLSRWRDTGARMTTLIDTGVAGVRNIIAMPGASGARMRGVVPL